MTRRPDFSPKFNESEKICKENQCEHFIVLDMGLLFLANYKEKVTISIVSLKIVL